MRLLAALIVVLIAAPAWAQCLVGPAVVPCVKPALRTVNVATVLQLRTAVVSARPGDAIVLAPGTYDTSLSTSVHGTAAAPILIMGGHIRPAKATSNDALNLNHNYYILRGTEVSQGWHGIQVNGRYVLLEDLNVHDTGVAGTLSGQGVLVLNSDVAIVRLTQARAGLTTPTPKLVHGVYLSDFYGRGVARVTVQDSTLRENGGAGLHIWNSTARTADVRIQGNTFERNQMGIVLTNVDRAELTGNTITRGLQADSVWLHLELSTGLRFVGNRLSATGNCALFAGYSQALAELWWSSNRWTWPCGYGDAELNAAGGH